mgnify:CR=1 FL=1
MRIPKLLFLLLLTLSCRTEEKLPIPEDRLVPLLANIHEAEALINEQTDAYAKDSLTDQYYDYLFELHQVEEAEFEATMAILQDDMPRLERLYIKVLEELALREAELK